MRWVEHGVRPTGQRRAVRRLDDLRRRFELSPRPGTPEADRGPGRAAPREGCSGRLTLDGAPFDARFLGAVVAARDGLVTPCQLELRRSAAAATRSRSWPARRRAAAACRARDRAVDRRAAAGSSSAARRWRWPRAGGRLSVRGSFSSARPERHRARSGRSSTARCSRPDGRPAARRDARRGLHRHHALRRGVGAAHRKLLRASASSVVGPDAVAGCARGATITLPRERPARAGHRASTSPARAGQLDLTAR